MERVAMSRLSPGLDPLLRSLWEGELKKNLENASRCSKENLGWCPIPQQPFSQKLAALPVSVSTQPLPAAARALPLLSQGRHQQSSGKNLTMSTFAIYPEWSWKHIQVVGIETIWVLSIFWTCCVWCCLVWRWETRKQGPPLLVPSADPRALHTTVPGLKADLALRVEF